MAANTTLITSTKSLLAAGPTATSAANAENEGIDYSGMLSSALQALEQALESLTLIYSIVPTGDLHQPTMASIMQSLV